jgi:hypothetical protein
MGEHLALDVRTGEPIEMTEIENQSRITIVFGSGRRVQKGGGI